MCDVQVATEFPFLYNIEMSGNRVTDLGPLSALRYLVQIDFSNNLLSDDVEIKGPFNLQDINLSQNKITSLVPLGIHSFLQRLCLDGLATI